jgi:protoporphyrinogen oxidase
LEGAIKEEPRRSKNKENRYNLRGAATNTLSSLILEAERKQRTGLPDFYWYMIPKPEKINTKFTKWSIKMP